MSGEDKWQSGIFVPGLQGRQICGQFTFEVFAEFRTRTTGSVLKFATIGRSFGQFADRKRNKRKPAHKTYIEC